ncbi:acidic leucine-rich nuclear phosphoprotein 32 family member A isoform X1 [Aricia agestis]|uniref:acidic leucine-rich nuclear phosphoprotein 32 family member A isoform X1 n=1 Tax=Aricia agestis TaxID=91739 RepID=UPI001C2044AA|nr:acidic leucine-rich nuclear phosphoprotein 32 family member A isoform X1 [Aricia agestis]
MEKRIDLELRRRSPSEIKELNLDNCRSTSIVGLSDEYVNLQILSLNNVGLTSLKGFPNLPKLWKLELSDNRISNGLNFLSGCKKLAHLNLSNNKIKDLETLKPLQDFENLKNLDLYNNDVTNIEDYRSKMFAFMPSIKYLDGFDKDDREAEDDEEGDDGEDDELNGNNDSEEDLNIDFGRLMIDDESLSDRSPETSPSLLITLYTVYGLLFHMGYLMKKDSDVEEEDGGPALSALYNNIDEESSDSSLYEGEEEEDEDDDEEDMDGENFGNNDQNSKANENSHGDPEESTRGKKRKHEDEEEN